MPDETCVEFPARYLPLMPSASYGGEFARDRFGIRSIFIAGFPDPKALSEIKPALPGGGTRQRSP